MSESPKQPLPTFEESHVEDGGVGVDELEQESLEVSLSSALLPSLEPLEE